MKRIAIFIFYDYENIVDDYVVYQLKELAKITERLVVVANNVLEQCQKEKLLTYASDLLERKNLGFDAGGFKDAILYHIKKEQLQEFDELILVNDSFYGPFYPWEDVFKTMDESKADFWGLTKCEQDKDKNDATYINSYFLVVRKKMLWSEEFMRFWQKMKYPDTFYQAVLDFEVEFTTFFVNKGFQYAVFTDYKEHGYLTKKGISPFGYYMYELLAESEFPILKRKPLSVVNFSKVIAALKYIDENTDYEVNMIEKHLERMEKGGRIIPFTCKEVDCFVEKYQHVFIYGHGDYGKQVNQYLEAHGKHIAGFVVTKRAENDPKEVREFQEIINADDTGFILALGRKNIREVYPYIVAKIRKEQLLLPRDEAGYPNNLGE